MCLPRQGSERTWRGDPWLGPFCITFKSRRWISGQLHRPIRLVTIAPHPSGAISGSSARHPTSWERARSRGCVPPKVARRGPRCFGRALRARELLGDFPELWHLFFEAPYIKLQSTQTASGTPPGLLRQLPRGRRPSPRIISLTPCAIFGEHPSGVVLPTLVQPSTLPSARALRWPPTSQMSVESIVLVENPSSDA